MDASVSHSGTVQASRRPIAVAGDERVPLVLDPRRGQGLGRRHQHQVLGPRQPWSWATQDRPLARSAIGAELHRDPEHRRLAGLDADWPPPERGLPIGAHSSQMLAAHTYLNAFDHWVKRELRVPGYLRFLDDTFFFADRERQLVRWRREIGEWLMRERGLRLKHPNARILSSHGRLNALGYRIRRQDVASLKRPLRRLHRRVRQHLAGTLDVDLERSIASSVGILLF